MIIHNIISAYRLFGWNDAPVRIESASELIELWCVGFIASRGRCQTDFTVIEVLFLHATYKWVEEGKMTQNVAEIHQITHPNEQIWGLF